MLFLSLSGAQEQSSHQRISTYEFVMHAYCSRILIKFCAASSQRLISINCGSWVWRRSLSTLLESSFNSLDLVSSLFTTRWTSTASRRIRWARSAGAPFQVTVSLPTFLLGEAQFPIDLAPVPPVRTLDHQVIRRSVVPTSPTERQCSLFATCVLIGLRRNGTEVLSAAPRSPSISIRFPQAVGGADRADRG